MRRRGLTRAEGEDPLYALLCRRTSGPPDLETLELLDLERRLLEVHFRICRAARKCRSSARHDFVALHEWHYIRAQIQIMANGEAVRMRVPPWDRSRGYLTDGALRAAARGDAPPRARRPFNALDPADQDIAAADGLISALLGVPSAFVRADVDEANIHTGFVRFTFEAGPDAASSVEPLARRALVVAGDYVNLTSFVEHRRDAAEAGGFVHQALGVAVGELLEDYRAFVLLLEDCLRLQQLTLQRLLFLVQPSVRSMALLKGVSRTVHGKHGGAALGALYEYAASHIGSEDAQYVLSFVLERAAAPVFRCLTVWMQRGVIDDRHNEFFIVENPGYAGAGKADDFGRNAWDSRYTVNIDHLPQFLHPFLEKILKTGKYVNVIRDARSVSLAKPGANSRRDANMQGVVSGGEEAAEGVEDAPDLSGITGRVLLGHEASRKIAAFVDHAYVSASSKLIGTLLHEVKVLDRLRSMKKFFLLEQGDFLVRFFDIAGDELAKNRADVSVDKLSSLLELSVRDSAMTNDQYHENLKCKLQSTDLPGQICDTLGADRRQAASHPALSADGRKRDTPGAQLSGYDTFTLDYAVSWPMNLIVTGIETLKYQLLFRYLFHCKYVERELGRCWKNLSRTRNRMMNPDTTLKRTHAIQSRMLFFVGRLLDHTVSDILEARWTSFEKSFSKATTIDEIMSCHSEFLADCLSRCLLNNDRHIRALYSVTRVCLLFTSYVDDFTRDVSKGNTYHALEEVVQRGNFADTIGKFEKTFDSHFIQLLDGFQNMSMQKASTHLSNLCICLDPNGYYAKMTRKAAADLRM